MEYNEQNLKHFTKDNAKEMGRLGGIKSGEVRREKKKMREWANVILEMPIKDGEVEEFTSLANSQGKNLEIGAAIIVVQAKKALKGDRQAAEFVRDTAGQKPTDKQEIKAEISGSNELDNILNILENYKNKQNQD